MNASNNRRLRVVARLAVLPLVMVFALVAVPATPTWASVGCYRQSCNDQDPQGMGCSADAGTIASLSDNGIYVELRLSTACSAAWTRATYNNCNYGGSIFTNAYYDWQGTQRAGGSFANIPCYGVTWRPCSHSTFTISHALRSTSGRNTAPSRSNDRIHRYQA